MNLFDGLPFPPPSPDDYVPSPTEAFLSFMLGYLLLVMLTLWLLPTRWTTWAFPHEK